ncbi:hypothetical protein [Enterococcus sp. HY326]|uniref:hypothetical protein n=1 Tax=Enterococcus sp. HY326 TaxID=2971265 RepID=UPI00223ED94B|nr:hypothetical protein [Enterococcus sp. HY326]
MRESFVVNPTLVKRLLESDVSSNEIARHTGVNQQEIRSYRTTEEQAALKDLTNMRLKLAFTLTKEAKRQKIRTHDTVFYTKDEICDALNNVELRIDEAEEEERKIKTLTLKNARKYASDENKIGIIRLGLLMKALDESEYSE